MRWWWGPLCSRSTLWVRLLAHWNNIASTLTGAVVKWLIGYLFLIILLLQMGESITKKWIYISAKFTIFKTIGITTGARGMDHPPFFSCNFLFTNLFSITFLYLFIILSLFPYFNLFVSIFQPYIDLAYQYSYNLMLTTICMFRPYFYISIYIGSKHARSI
jgi:hypothetical protein